MELATHPRRQGPARLPRPGLRLRVTGAAMLASAIFLVDTFTDLGSAVAVLYVLVILLVGDLGSTSLTRLTSALTAILTIGAFLYAHGLDTGSQSFLRLLFSLAAIGVTTLLLLRSRGEREAAQAALEASEHRYRTIFETLAVAIWEHDFRELKQALTGLRDSGVTDLARYLADHPEFVSRARRMIRITDANQTALNLMGVASKQDFFHTVDEFLPEDDQGFARFLVALDRGQRDFQAETTVRGRHGRTIPVMVALRLPGPGGEFDRVQGSIIDMTERHRFQDALETSRRELEASARAAMIGEISASIAHEVNQPLAVVMASVQAAQRWMKRTPPDLAEAMRALDDGVLATERAADVVRRVRMLLGKAKPEKGEVVIDRLLADTIRLRQTELTARKIRLALRLGTAGQAMRGDRILLQQAFINIISNAIQAMDATAPEDRSLVVESELSATHLAIRFADTGPGLSPDLGDRLFKAFSTTKPDGMGLGLAMCRSIVMAHDGTITLADRTNARGALVEILFPLSSAGDLG